MREVSEKLIYSQKLEAITDCNFLGDGFIWGEELYDCKLVIYKDSIQEIPNYYLIADDFLKLGLVLVKPNANIQYIMVQYDEETLNVYISLKRFNDHWWAVKATCKLCELL